MRSRTRSIPVVRRVYLADGSAINKVLGMVTNKEGKLNMNVTVSLDKPAKQTIYGAIGLLSAGIIAAVAVSKI